MKGRIWKTGLTALSVLLLVLLLHGLSESAEKKMRVGVVTPPPAQSLISESIKAWADEVTKRTNGAITFEIFWGAALGSFPEHVELVKNGSVDVAFFNQSYKPTWMPFGDFEYAFPFGPLDYELVVKAMRQIRSEVPQFTKELTEHNMVLMADLPLSVYSFLSRKPMRTVEDFRGKKVAVVGRWFGKWLPPGATSVVRAAGARYDLMRSGVVDADLLSFGLQHAFKIHEVAKYYLGVNVITPCGGVIMMNKKTFDSLSPEQQKIALDAGKDIEMRAAKEVIPRWRDRIFKEWKAANIEFIDFPEEERLKWVNSVPDTPAEWASEMDAQKLPGSEVVRRWQEITTQLGYKWPRKWGQK